jgi:hypothetical protein
MNGGAKSPVSGCELRGHESEWVRRRRRCRGMDGSVSGGGIVSAWMGVSAAVAVSRLEWGGAGGPAAGKPTAKVGHELQLEFGGRPPIGAPIARGERCAVVRGMEAVTWIPEWEQAPSPGMGSALAHGHP